MAVLLMLGLWLGLIGLSSSESLHRFFHSDSQQATHECLVTFFSKSYLLAAFAPIAALLVVFVCFGWSRLAEDGLPPVADLRLAPTRGPPVGSLLP
jgi:hypothetical protein